MEGAGLKNFLKNFYIKARRCFFCLLTCISPELNNKIRYLEIFKKPLPIDDPVTFQEKLLWLKLKNYNNNPLVIKCADKYAVREYVRSCGYEDILNELTGVFDSPDEIDWDSLPQQFVLKWNFGAGMNIVCSEKSKLDKEETVKKLKKWGKRKYWLSHGEMHYKFIPKKIICEKYLSDSINKVIPDYKVYCFNGKPLAVLVMEGRGSKISAQFFDKDWNKLKNSEKYEPASNNVEKPVCLKEMIEAAEKLSAPFPFVRCDFYIVNGKLYFGELTFTPAGGFYPAQTEINGRSMGEYIVIKLK